MKTPILALAALGLVIGIAAPLAAQSLLDNQYYHKAQDLLKQSQQAYDQGDYDAATDLANQAKDQFAQSEAYIAELTQFYRANGYLSVAKDRVAYAKSIDADVHYKDAYTRASRDVGDAKTALDGKDYPKSIDLSQKAIALLKDVAPVTKQVTQTPAATEPGPVELPQYYTVRLILPLRDCFWRIAAYPFVYNDPWKWKLLYNANKDVLENPENPNLIEVGMRFVIPALADEKRSGDFDPSVEYPALPSK
jgi:tetratricopeptide (TPR) repeat protein